MYKIFFGDRYLLISDKSTNNSAQSSYSIDAIDDIKQFILKFESDKSRRSCSIITNNCLETLQDISKCFEYIEAAGGVVFNQKKEILVIYRYHKWDLPKGKIELNEAVSDCAIREVQEECGIQQLQITKQLQSTYHTYVIKNQLYIKQTFWFEMQYFGSEKGKPQTEEHITEIRWIDKSALPHIYINTYPSVIEVIEQCM